MFSNPVVKEKKKKRKKKQSKKTHVTQGDLKTGRTKELNGAMKYYTEQLCQLKTELEIINYIVENPKGESATLTALTLQRDNPDSFSSIWWWCHPRLDEMWEVGEDMPKAEDYEWGNYWGGSNDDVERYVVDRAKWRQPGLLFEIKQAEERLENSSKKMW